MDMTTEQVIRKLRRMAKALDIRAAGRKDPDTLRRDAKVLRLAAELIGSGNPLAQAKRAPSPGRSEAP